MLSYQICDIFQKTYLEEHLRTTASKHRNSFLEVFCRSCCLALINAVMKYSFFAALVQSWRGNLLKNCTPSQVFFKEFHNSCRTARSSHQRCSIIKGVLRNFPKLTGKHLCQSLFFNKVLGLRPATLLKKRL